MLRPSSSYLILITRTISSSCRYCAKSNHYDVLGITPKATQNEIKTAYYKLSKIHHPDKSKDEQSASKFRDITQAYEVLGNIQLKKIYDKGLLGRPDRPGQPEIHYRTEPEPTDPTVKFYKSRTRQQIVRTMDGQTPIYNFDDWSREHYGSIFKKAQYEREHLKKILQKRADEKANSQSEALLYFMLAIGGLFIFLGINGTSDYDKDRISHKKKETEANTDNK